MAQVSRFLAVIVAIGVFTPVDVDAQPVRITELLAANRETFNDDDGDFVDWIELHNESGQSISLEGWFLTDDRDDPTQWEFPSFELPPRDFRIVFASDKNRVEPGAPLHTNFQLDQAGEYLALVNPSGEIVSEYDFPRQKADVSYGVGRPRGERIALIDSPSRANAWIPSHSFLDEVWMSPSFDHREWRSGSTGVGYDYGDLIGLNVEEMHESNGSVYVRVPFEIDPLPSLTQLFLRLQYDDGVIVYLNGKEVFRANAPDGARWNSTATGNRPDSAARSPTEIDLTPHIEDLREGHNLLAIHGLNKSLDSSDLLVRPELVGVLEPDEPEQSGYLFRPTPRALNPASVPELLAPPRLSEPSRTFQNELTVQATLPAKAPKEATLRYTTDGTIPNATAKRYTGPIRVSTTAQLRARAFGPNGGRSRTVGAAYIKLGEDAADFSSNLPLVVVDNFGRGRPPQDPKQNAFMAVFEPYEAQGGRSMLTEPPHSATRIGVEVHGSSTAGRPKFSMSFEARNARDADKNVSLLGLPSESDWLLWGPYNFDRAMMRNPLIYRLSNQVGRYAVRTRYVEVFFNPDGDSLRREDYFGVYVLMEDITRDDDRVAIEELFVDHTQRPGVTGGYILKIDRPDPGDQGFRVGGQRIQYDEPTEIEIEQPIRQPQQEYIQGFFRRFTEALNSSNFRNPIGGYRPFLDVDAAIDHHLLNVLAFNVDALRLSTYMVKRREGQLVFGPIWDFDRSMGSTDGRDANPRVWRAQTGDKGTDFFNYTWWDRLFQDIDFFQRYIDRWHELRQGAFSLENIHGMIDTIASRLAEAQPRDLDRWGQTPRFGGYDGEIAHLKQWLADRVDFIDSQFVEPPELEPEGGLISPGAEITMTAPGDGTIYYTLDGSDPRQSGGEIAERARAYQEAIRSQEAKQLTARVFDPSHESLTGPGNPPMTSHWSPPIQARFSIEPPPAQHSLIVSELHYNPLPPMPQEMTSDSSRVNNDFEFLELKNVGPETIDLAASRLTGGVEYTFTPSKAETLAPGEVVLLVNDRAAFHARYGTSQKIIGEFQGTLSNTGERLRLVSADDQTVFDFQYRNTWHPATDGHGFSLTARKAGGTSRIQERRTAWQPSRRLHGSPAGPGPSREAITGVRINEIRAAGTSQNPDAIELFNRTDAPVDIGGWLLSDDQETPAKFQIPKGTSIPGGGYLVFDRGDFNVPRDGNEPFGLDADGEAIFLFAATEDRELLGYAHGIRFGPTEEGISLGVHQTSGGREHALPQTAATFGEPNAGPRIGPLVISEVMYNPRSPDSGNNSNEEYIELTNITDRTIPLAPTSSDQPGWTLVDGVDYAFESDTTLAGGQSVVVVGFDPEIEKGRLARFQTALGMDQTGAAVVGPFEGQLDNAGENLTLLRPAEQSERLIIADGLDYGPSTPWPKQADGRGSSLQRIFLRRIGVDPLHWIADAPTPGYRESLSADRDTDRDGLPDRWETVYELDPESTTGINGREGDPDNDGASNYRELQSGTNPLDAQDRLRIISIEHQNSRLRLTFEAQPGRSYQLESQAGSPNGDWSASQEAITAPQEQTVEVTLPFPSNAARAFYRLRVNPSGP